MKKIIKRLVVFFIGFPILLSAVVLFPHQNHLFLNLAVTVFSVLGAVEFRNILTHKNLVVSIPEAIILGALIPASWTAVLSFGLSRSIVQSTAVLGATWLLVSRVFSDEEKLLSSVSSITAGFAVLIYPGLFLAWIIKMAVFPRSEIVIAVFFLVAFLNDAAAWLVGMLFGKNNRGIVKASPKKSLAGFIGGLAASVITGSLAAYLVPGAFTSTLMPSIPAGAVLGLLVGFAAILGDLGESVIKRSAGVKDSGTLILGRGGALDSIDSLALAAPIFYLVYLVLFIKAF